MSGSTSTEFRHTVVVGGGAAGLMAAIQARRADPGKSVAVLDGATRLGAKILIAGGGRCNVTHHAVDETAFSGSTPAAIRKVLRRFDVAATIAFFRELGVELKREETGKLFPVTDRARTVLDALIGEAVRRGAEILPSRRVERVDRIGGGTDPGNPRLSVSGQWGRLVASRVVLATGGMSVPKTGSDGHGLAIARSLGHTTTPLILPALVPLTLPEGHPLIALRGVSVPAALEVRSRTGKRLAEVEGPVLFTHFGLSGPAILDVSRHYLHAAAADGPKTHVLANWLPGTNEDTVDRELRELGARSPMAWLRERLPDRLARTLVAGAGIDPGLRGGELSRERRRTLAGLVSCYPLPVTGSRGFAVAEVTAGGVPLAEVRLDTLESRIVPGLHLVGEILDVDGRIGGFNFQWAWASGFTAGTGATGSEA